MKKILCIFITIVTILLGLFFWYGTCISLYVYSPQYLINNQSKFTSIILADLVNKTGSCKMRNYDLFLINILKTDIKEQRVCDKCMDSLGRLANASLNRKYNKNISFLTESEYYFSINLMKNYEHEKNEFLGIDSLNTFVKIEEKDYQYMNSLWKTVKTKKDENSIEKTELINFTKELNKNSIQNWELLIKH